MKINQFFTIILFFIYLNTNAQWQQTSLNTGLISCIAATDTNIFVGNYYSGVYLSTDNGDSWTSVKNGFTGIFLSSIVISGTKIFVSTRNGGVFVSTNNGGLWSAVNNGLTNTGVYALAISDTNIFAGTESGLFLSGTNNISWAPVNNGLSDTFIISFAISGLNIFAGTLHGGVCLSTNNGSNWIAVNNGLTDTATVPSLTICGTNIFAAPDPLSMIAGVYLSTDNGNSWVSVNNNLPTTLVNTLASSGTTIFTGTANGVFFSTNNGTYWTAFNDSLNDNIASMAVIGSNIFAGTYNSGIWKRPLSEMANIKDKTGNPHFTLSPNPFTDFFTVQFETTATASPNFTLYDFTGKQIPLLPLPSSRFPFFSFSTSHLPPGLYFLIANINGKTQTFKIVKM